MKKPFSHTRYAKSVLVSAPSKSKSNTDLESQCSSFFKADKDDGRVSVIWPGSAAHYMQAMQYPRWEDYRFEPVPEARNNLFAWFGNGLTRAQQGHGSVSKFLDDTNIPPIINNGPRPGHVDASLKRLEVVKEEDKSKELGALVSTLSA